jgi:hypothetical protein
MREHYRIQFVHVQLVRDVIGLVSHVTALEEAKVNQDGST